MRNRAVHPWEIDRLAGDEMKNAIQTYRARLTQSGFMRFDGRAFDSDRELI